MYCSGCSLLGSFMFGCYWIVRIMIFCVFGVMLVVFWPAETRFVLRRLRWIWIWRFGWWVLLIIGLVRIKWLFWCWMIFMLFRIWRCCKLWIGFLIICFLVCMCWLLYGYCCFCIFCCGGCVVILWKFRFLILVLGVLKCSVFFRKFLSWYLILVCWMCCKLELKDGL